MAKLLAKSPCQGLLPIVVGSCSLEEQLPAAITSITPFAGQQKQVSAALKDALGVTFPAPNRATGKEGSRCIWSGMGQALFIGPTIKPIKGAAHSDQSDAWAVMRLTGPDAVLVLAKLAPVNLAHTSFRRGHTVRTLLNHMAVLITRTGTNAFDIMVFRSMAQTAVHELETAMKSVAALTQQDE